MIQPKDAQLITESELAIKWEDGHESFYSAQYLRQHCRCASCVSELSGKQILKHESVPSDLSIRNFRQVGSYAYGFTFSDGHQTGIYAYEHLRKICPCDTCQ